MLGSKRDEPRHDNTGVSHLTSLVVSFSRRIFLTYSRYDGRALVRGIQKEKLNTNSFLLFKVNYVDRDLMNKESTSSIQ